MVFLPLRDDNPLRIIQFQYATLLIFAINVFVFIWQDSLPQMELVSVAMSGGLVPSVFLNGAKLPPEFANLPTEVTLITYMFLHGDWWHLAGNMLFLWVFADNVEDAMGFVRFILFYLICGIIAGLAHAFANPGSDGPLIGASGAIGGVVGAYMMLYPRVKMWVLAFGRIPLKIPAYLMVGAWDCVPAVLGLDAGPERHGLVGPILAGSSLGVALVFVFKRPGQPMFAGRTRELVRRKSRGRSAVTGDAPVNF
jgi:membrane associated rhomboid family serine protease